MVNFGKSPVEYSDVSSEALSEPEAGEIQSDDSVHDELSEGEVSADSPEPPPPARRVQPPASAALGPAPGAYGRAPSRSPSAERQPHRDKRKRRHRERDGSGKRRRRRSSRYSASPDGRLPSASPISSGDDVGSTLPGRDAALGMGEEVPPRRRASLGGVSPFSSNSDGGIPDSPNGEAARSAGRGRSPPYGDPGGRGGRARRMTPPSAEKRRKSRSRSHDRERRKRSPVGRSRSRSPR